MHFPLVVLHRRVIVEAIERWPIDIEAPDLVTACRRAVRAARLALGDVEILGVIFDGEEHTS